MFLLETYMELIICTVICFRNWEIRDIWSTQDKVSVACHLIITPCVAAFTIFITWFTFKKIKGLIAVKKVEHIDKNEEFIEEVRAQYKQDKMEEFE